MSFVPAKCTQCGADIEIDDTHEVGICKYCGTAFVTEKVIKNYNNTINVDNATINISGAGANNLLLRAAQFEKEGNTDKALEYYNKVLDIDIKNPAALLGVERLSAFYINYLEVSKKEKEYIDSLLLANEKVKVIKYIKDIKGIGLKEAKELIESYSASDRQAIKNTQASGGCYIATSVYGSYDCPQVWILRRYRDYFLANVWYGRLFVKCYYTISPHLVKWFGNTKWFKKIWVGILDKKINKLQDKGIKDTPYIDKKW